MFFGENDNHITQDDVSKIREKLHEHSKEAEIVIYPHAGHGFFCEERDAYQERAAQNSWQRVLKFMGNRL
jgi:carboxymethylenebutenolidase